ncbi:class I SAM-dependent methyltransferase [Magnetospira thiophila]
MTLSVPSSASPWSRHARQWSHVGSPLRPISEDCQLYWRLLAPLIVDLDAPKIMMMGVTPELALLPWPRQCHLTAIDQNPDMIARVWPTGLPPCDNEAICAQWQHVPLKDAAFDLALGDGALTTLSSPDEYLSVFRELHRILRPGGRVFLRCFVRPEATETLDHIFADLEANRIGSFHVLKWRVAMALQTRFSEGVAVALIRESLCDRLPDRAAAAGRLGWPEADIQTIDAYEGSSAIYTFPTLAEIETTLEGRFQISGVVTPTYELGARCPLIQLERRP